MLRVLCAVEHDESSTSSVNEWPVLKAVESLQTSPRDVFTALSSPQAIHVFASRTSMSFFLKLWSQLTTEQKMQLAHLEMTACGVGSTTDTLARQLTSRGVVLRWTLPDLGDEDGRHNGLLWTLTQLELRGLIPNQHLHLWTKQDSTSEKILSTFKEQRHWPMWPTYVHPLYALHAHTQPLPTSAVQALSAGQSICLAAKSAEVLDAALMAVLKHLQINSVDQLPSSICFSVWETSAHQRAAQLGLDARLVEWVSKHSLTSENSN